MKIRMTKWQCLVILLLAFAIILVQLVQFYDRGLEGYGWIFSFLISGGLIFLCLTKNSNLEAFSEKPEPINSTSSREDVESKHQELRDNAEVLAVEVEQRSSFLADTLIREREEGLSGLDVSVKSSKKLGDQYNQAVSMLIREWCTYLMLGLVGVRRSRGSAMYINGLEFRTLQKKVSGSLIKMAVDSHRLMPSSGELDAGAISKDVMNNLLQIRKAITQCCISLEERQDTPEMPLLEWFKGKSGIEVKGYAQISQALIKESDQKEKTAR